MASQLENGLCCIKQYEQNSIGISVRVDDWKAEWTIIASNDKEIFGNPEKRS